MSRQRYTLELKDEAVRQVLDRGYPVADVAELLGVSAHSLYKLVKAVKPRLVRVRSCTVRRDNDIGLRKRAEYGIGPPIKYIKQNPSGAVWLPIPTLPMPQCPKTDTERSSELSLGHAHLIAHGLNVCSRHFMNDDPVRLIRLMRDRLLETGLDTFKRVTHV